jgi:hypothetical protein
VTDFWTLVFDLLLILTGAAIEVSIEEVFKGSIRGPVHFLYRKLRLSLVRDIEIEVKREGRADLSTVDEGQAYSTVVAYLDLLSTALRKAYLNVERRGETQLLARSTHEDEFDLVIEAVPPEQGEEDAAAVPVILAVKTRTGYIGLVESLFGIVNELDRLCSIASSQGLPVEFGLGQGAVTIRLKTAPTVLAVLSKLEVSDLRAEFKKYKMDLGASGIVFRGDLTTDMARQIKKIVTWYY